MSESGYKDSMFWASEEEIAAYRERQEKAAQQASKEWPVYTSHTYRRKGERVYVDVRKSGPAVKLNGFSI